MMTTWLKWEIRTIVQGVNLQAAIPDFSPVRAVQEQGISARRRSLLLRGLNNAVPGPL